MDRPKIEARAPEDKAPSWADLVADTSPQPGASFADLLSWTLGLAESSDQLSDRDRAHLREAAAGHLAPLTGEGAEKLASTLAHLFAVAHRRAPAPPDGVIIVVGGTRMAEQDQPNWDVFDALADLFGLLPGTPEEEADRRLAIEALNRPPRTLKACITELKAALCDRHYLEHRLESRIETERRLRLGHGPWWKSPTGGDLVSYDDARAASEAEAEAFLLAESVRAAGLTPAEEQALTLSTEGYSPDEIAAALGCARATFYVHRSNARRKIRGAI